MLTELPFEFSGKVFRSPMPFSNYGGQDIWKAYQQTEISYVVVLAEKQEFLVFAGRDLSLFYREQGLEVLHLPVPDFGIPTDLTAWEDGLSSVSLAARDGRNVAVHCLAGLGRTGIFLACLAKRIRGLDGSQAIQWVREYLPGAMENQLQESFVIDY